MKEKKKKRKILTALIPVLVFLLAVALLAQGVLKSEPEAVPNPVQGISADSSLKGYLGTGFAYAGSKNDGNGEEMAEQQEEMGAHILDINMGTNCASGNSMSL